MEQAHQLLYAAVKIAVLAISFMALAVVLYGTVEAFVGVVRWIASGRSTARATGPRILWTHYARWLVAGLTFLLAADVIETIVAPDLEDILRLGAIAVIRTFLNFFLERDMKEALELGEKPEASEKDPVG